ncbi:chromosome partitioning protein ParB [Vibrio aquaticus]|uniref:Chromosome partitioning protein ParB n=1 Tax=Vibrio aquaticus TaxID=2496559 RepID=A0A3S0MMD3_9VIBR|nr:ParB/RepB/Spo0J family partition protein [Vibrio aquaticus]RTZ17896.1 chromosome partitioning protein ParB [Vibrio aquaticus]
MDKTIEKTKQLFRALSQSTQRRPKKAIFDNNETTSSTDTLGWISTYNQLTDLVLKQFPLLPPICSIKLLPLNKISANDYNPNKMAKPEGKLLLHSLEQDGLTLPILVNLQSHHDLYTIIDGFHRYELIKKHSHLQTVKGYIPAIVLSKSKGEAMSSSIRHNIARGVHQVELTANMVIALKQMNWSNEEIGRELGMDKDEVLRMQQITGLADAFKDQDFSTAWE